MGTIRKIIGSELIGTLGQEEIYPVTHAKAVYGYVNSAHSITADKSLYSILDDLYTNGGGGGGSSESTIESISLNSINQAIDSNKAVNIKTVYKLPSCIVDILSYAEHFTIDAATIISTVDPNSSTGAKYTIASFMQQFRTPNCLYSTLKDPDDATSGTVYYNIIFFKEDSRVILYSLEQNVELDIGFSSLEGASPNYTSVSVDVTQTLDALPVSIPINTISLDNIAVAIDSNKNANIKTVYKMPSFIVSASNGDVISSDTITNTVDPNSSTGAKFTPASFIKLFSIPNCIYSAEVGTGNMYLTISFLASANSIMLNWFTYNKQLTLNFTTEGTAPNYTSVKVTVYVSTLVDTTQEWVEA